MNNIVYQNQELPQVKSFAELNCVPKAIKTHSDNPILGCQYDPVIGNWETIRYYRRCGLNVIPLWVDHTRNPLIKWKPYETEPIPEYKLRSWFGNPRNPRGIGLICGETSGGLEVLDFDDPSLWLPWIRTVAKNKATNGLLAFAPLIQTPSGGYHILWRSEHYGPCLKLAYKDCDPPKIAIETRGDKGLGILPGSPPETHRLNKDYMLIGGNFASIPKVSKVQREILLDIARSFDLGPKKEPKIYCNKTSLDNAPDTGKVSGSRPGDDFNRRGDWRCFLFPKEWKIDSESERYTHWCRPGKDYGRSASTGLYRAFADDKIQCPHNDNSLEFFHVFSSNAHPFEAGETYTKFAAFTLLWCGGDYKVAAKYLSKSGYGNLTETEDEIKTIITRYQK